MAEPSILHLHPKTSTSCLADIPVHDASDAGLGPTILPVLAVEPQADESDIPEWKVDNDYSHYLPMDHSKQEIRLASISPGLFDDPLECSLTRHELTCGDVGFEALSYCWGDLNDTVTLTLRHDYHGSGVAPRETEPKGEWQTFNVTRTLDRALRYLRLEEKPRTVWIDALCINQGSIKERNYAIAFMADVYRLASSVAIFLGEEGTSTHFQGLWDLMGMLNGALERAGAKPLWQHEDIGKALDEIRLVPKAGAGPRSDSDDGAFKIHMSFIFEEFFKYPWFKRVWVVQEAMHARHAVVHCGRRQIDWRDVAVVLCWAVKSSRSYSGGFATSLDLRDRLPPFLWTRLHAAKCGRIDAPARVPLLEVISRGRAFGATDPRDKVFALLSFGEETSDLNLLSPRLKPDYAKSPSTVWADLTRQWIIDHGSLDILSILREEVDKNNQIAAKTVFVGDGPGFSQSRPSNAIQPPPAGHPSWALWHAQHPDSAEQGLFRAANALTPSSYPLDLGRLDSPADPAVLTLRGGVLDFVDKVQWAFKRWTYSDDDIRQFDYNTEPPRSMESGVAVAWGAAIGAVQGVGAHDSEHVALGGAGEIVITPYPDGRSRLQAFIEALTCRRLSAMYFHPGRSMSLDDDDADGAASLTEVQRADLEVIAHFAAHWATGADKEMKWIPGPWADALRGLSRHGSSRRFTELCGFAEGRCFFQSRRGVFGLCPRGTRRGDAVVSLAGGNTPFVLRRVAVGGDEVGTAGAQRWSLVGDCYMQGVDIKGTTQLAVDAGREARYFDIV